MSDESPRPSAGIYGTKRRAKKASRAYFGFEPLETALPPIQTNESGVPDWELERDGSLANRLGSLSMGGNVILWKSIHLRPSVSRRIDPVSP